MNTLDVKTHSRPVIAENYRRILEAIAAHPAGEPVDVSGALPNWPSRYATAQRMADRGWITQTASQPWESGGTPTPLYELTERGVIALELARAERKRKTRKRRTS